MTRFCGIGKKILHLGGSKRAELGRRLMPNEITARCQRDYGSCPTRLRLVVSMLLMLTLGSGSVWGQETPDYSGTYYIGSHGYVEANTTTNYYLCPTEDWYYYQSTSPYYTGSDNGMPFMTTYQCRNGVYSSENAVWIVEKQSNGYYHIKRAIDGKYLTYNGAMGSGNKGRMRVHLQQTADGDNALFQIEYINSNAYDITTKNSGPDNIDRKYLNVTGNNGNGNQASLTGTDIKNDGPNSIYVGGIIGLWTSGSANDNASKWYLEKATIDPPVITDNGDGTVTITAGTGATIYWTIDGTTPTTSTPTTSTSGTGTNSVIVSLTESTEVVKAIAKSPSDYFSTIVKSYKLTRCATPVITVTNGTVSISCSTTGASIYYTINDTEATPSSTPYNNTPFSIGDASVIRAIAAKVGYAKSEEVLYMEFKTVSSSTEINNMRGLYRLASNFTSEATIGSSSEPFTGVIDGQFNTIHQSSALDHPLVAYVDGATIKNVIVGNVNIVSGTDVGAICNEADGSTKIYNCGVLSGSVSGSNNVGGLVGLIKASSSVRVVNCFNYANVSGGSYAAGIVGKNEGTVGDVRIALCMMYGNVTNATNISPVYGGNHTSSEKNFTEYNYWRYRSGMNYTVYNDQLAIDKDEYLTRFPFYRHILNTHRELASYFLFGDYEKNHVSEIGHWVLDKSTAPYPIVEEWKNNTKRTTVDIKDNLPNTSDERKGKLLTTMGTDGYLTVNVSINGTDYSSVLLPITDMNEDNYDYTYGKVVLPFANEFSGWTHDYSKVCTGWEITSVTGSLGEGKSYEAFEHYNFANRNCKDKDIYNATTNPYVFAQGGNYIVPYGVTSISITAHFAKAFYLCDPEYEVGFDSNFTSNQRTPKGGATRSNYNGQTVYHDLTTLVAALSSANNPNDQAIVLVGNFHYLVTSSGEVLFNTGRAVTIMSADDDCNQEPDYGWYMGNTSGRLELPALRFDFVPIIELGMSSRVGKNKYPGIGIWHTRGWFEQTETCVSYSSQCEINSDNFANAEDGHGNNRWIINSGFFTQVVRARDGACNKLSYIQIGGNAFVKELYPGCHSDAASAKTNPTVPIIVTGGEVEECFMSGYNTAGKLSGDMIYFWCAGGRIKKFLGAYLEEPTAAGLTAKIDHALIGRFFGGGTSASARIKGDIDITINNSQVDFYCGGPEFGNMESGKKVTTHATGSTFGEYYGAGYGGTSITYYREYQDNAINFNDVHEFPISFSTYKRLAKKTNFGIGNCYKFEYIFHSNGQQGVARFYTGYAQFDLATTGNVTNILNGCIIKKLPGENSPTIEETSGDFYGAGCQGKVSGTVTSTLTGCEIQGSAFGGGYKASSNNVEVYTTTPPSYSVYTKETGIFSDFGEFPTPENFAWKPGNSGSNDSSKELYTGMTQAQMDELGNVTGNIILTIDGGTVGAENDNNADHGNVYGGGNESKSLSNTTVTLKGDAVIYGNVFGGGNKAEVQGSTEVNIVNEE